MMLRSLAPGDLIAMIAPASPFDTNKFNRACGILKERGFRVSPGKHVLRRNGYLAGSEVERADDLIRAVTDPAVSAIFCIRGGYGSGKILPWLPFTTLRGKPKIFLGYSDITFLHLAFQSQMNWITFHGPNLMDLVDVPTGIDHVIGALSGDGSFSWEIREADVLRHGTASGNVFGGNLTCMVHLIGTPYFPDLTGAILIVEDCSEALYRLDRLFTQLKLAGILRRLKGLMLGKFKDCGESSAIWKMVLEQVKDYDFPVVANLPFGHVPTNQVFPLGTPFSLNTNERSFRALKHPFER